ncbi:MAG: lipid-A-disaccharide synthase [Geobacteraceae bacterium]|nr:lipid-A-disaccharide synthase [Geobacteraceae bacterium]
MIIAGEASGDLHGANLVREVLKRDSSIAFLGIGGSRMREAGVDTLVDASDMAVVGLVEVIAHFPTIFSAFKRMKQILLTEPPDLLILIDYPDFNLRLACVAKKAGVRVLYYISPQVWAWRVGRVKKIGRLVDHMAVVFPFEVPFYERENIPVTFVGHPLVDSVRPLFSKVDARKRFELDPGGKVVGLFPGSRKQELRNLFPVILQAAELLKKRFPEIQFILPLASSLKRADIDPFLESVDFPVSVIEGMTYDVIQVCDSIITVSGTVTLEIAMLCIPMVIIYRVSPLTYAIGKRLIKVDHIGICNIVAGERMVKELVQDEARPGRIADEIEKIIRDPEYDGAIRSKYNMMRERLGGGGCSAKVADIALTMLNQ